MKKYIHYILIFLFCTFYAEAQEQGLTTLEVAPYFVDCENPEGGDCIQLLDMKGDSVGIIGLNAIKGFKANPGFEYTLQVQILPEEKNAPQYELKKILSKLWVPQYALDAPELKGSFKVVGVNGVLLNPNQTELIINANNSVMRGSTDCNNYHLFFKQLGYSLIFSKILTTDLFCSSRRPLQDEYFIVFNSVHHFEFQGDVLRLYDFNDKLLLEANLLK